MSDGRLKCGCVEKWEADEMIYFAEKSERSYSFKER
jgi:hypothetical protein